jgi:disulfide bond formation protein DsbB
MINIIYLVITVLSLLGIYHIYEEIVWQIHIEENPKDIEDMIEYMEAKKKNE